MCFAARARILVYHTGHRVVDAPRSFFAFLTHSQYTSFPLSRAILFFTHCNYSGPVDAKPSNEPSRASSRLSSADTPILLLTEWFEMERGSVRAQPCYHRPHNFKLSSRVEDSGALRWLPYRSVNACLLRRAQRQPVSLKLNNEVSIS